MRSLARVGLGLAMLTSLGVGVRGASERTLPLLDAVKANNAAAARVLLQQRRGDVNAPDADGSTALHWAVYRDDMTLVDLLLRAGANPKAANRYGVTPLLLAVENASAAASERLLNAGADANTELAGGETLLMDAARTGNATVVQLLLRHGASVNASEETRGQTALMWAASEGHADVVATLCEAGADIRAVSHAPASTQSEDRRKRRGIPRADVFTPLMFAVRAGQTEAARALVRAGADVNETLPDGTGALVLAVMNAHYELASVLLSLGADPNASKQGWTVLHQVARTRTLNIVQFPHPVPTGHIDGVELTKRLLAYGADINARMTKSFNDGFRTMFNYIGSTPYLVAAKGADATMMRLLVANGADAFVSNVTGTTALMATAGVDMFAPDEDGGTLEEGVAALKIAVALGGDVNTVNNAGDTALHGAAYRGSTEMIQQLVDRGARLDARNKSGFSALQIANGEQHALQQLQRRPESIALLRQLMIAKGLNPEMKSEDEHYSFGVAVK
jgi:uncharacterized protein